MQPKTFAAWIAWWIISGSVGAAAPALDISDPCGEFVPLYEALAVNETFVTDLTRRESDGLIIGVACGKKQICLFRFDAATNRVELLDALAAPWWDEPRLALGPGGDIYLGARRTFDKPFVFERLGERPQTPDSAYKRRDVVPAPGEINEKAAGMPIRHYAPDGKLLNELPLPESLASDGIGALVVCGHGQTLCALSAPGGHLLAISLATGAAKDYGQVVPFPEHHHTRYISRVFMLGADGQVYFAGCTAPLEGDRDRVMGSVLAFDPTSGKLRMLTAQLPAVTGRRRFAAVDAAVRLSDGSFLGGTNDGYLFRFDPGTETVEGLGKPLRQGRICGLAIGADGLVYGAGGEPGGLPRLFAFDPAARRLYLGAPPSGSPPEHGTNTFGDIGGIACAADGTLVCGERERRGFLLLYRP